MKLKKFQPLAAASVLALAALLAGCGDEKPEVLLASAKDYLAKNDGKAAVIQLKNALQQQPNLAEGRYLLGLALLSSGDPVNAEIELRKAIELKHSADTAVPRLAQALLQQGKFKKVTEEFAKTSLSTPAANSDLQTTLAQAYGAQGDNTAAKTALDAALKGDPTNVAAALMEVRRKLSTGDVAGASTQLDQVLAAHPKDFEAWKLQGDLLFYAKRQPEEGLAAYRKSVEIKPDFLAGYAGSVTALLAQGKLPEAEKDIAALKKLAPNHPQTRLLELQIAYAKKDFKLGRELAQQLLKMTPTNPRALQMAGGVELQLNSLVTAEDYLSKAVQAAPELAVARRWLVLAYLRSGQAARALTTLTPLLDEKTADAGVLALAGEVYLQNGDTKKAEDYLLRATKLNPDDKRNRTSLAMTRLAAGKTDAAFGELEDIAAADTGTAADMALISAHLRRREFDKALKAIDGLEKKTPTNAMAANLRGRTQLAMKNTSAARSSFEAALTINPAYFPAAASLAAMDLADKKPAEARKRFETLIAKDPKNARALVSLAGMRERDNAPKEEVVDLLTKSIAADPTEPGPRVLLVNYYLRQKDVKQATLAAQNGLAATPDKPELLDALGRTQILAEDYNQAIITFGKLATLQPKATQPLMFMADANLAAKSTSAAQQNLTKALELQPNLLAAQLKLANMYVAQGKYAEATALSRQVQKQRPKDAVGFMMEGDALARQKNFDGAAAVYRSALKQVPSPDLAIKLHAALSLGGKTADAEKFASSWIKDQPKDVALQMYMGDIALSRKDYPTAEKLYTNVVERQPGSAIAYNNLAWVTAELKKDGAIAFAEKAIGLAPNQPAFMDTLAMLLAEKHEYKKAIELQTKALALQSENPVFKLNMAKIYAQAGEKDSAKKQLDDLAKLGEKFSGQAEVSKLRATL